MITNIQRSKMASGNDDDLFKVSVIEDKGEKFKVHCVG